MIQARLGAINTGHSEGPGDTGPTPTQGGGGTSPYQSPYGGPGGSGSPGTYQPPPGPYQTPPPYQGPTYYPPASDMPDSSSMPPPLPVPEIPTSGTSPGTVVTVTPPTVTAPDSYAIAGRAIPLWALGLGAGILGTIIAIVIARK